MKYNYLIIAALAFATISCSKTESGETETEGTAAAAKADETPIVVLGVAVAEDVPQTKSYTATVEADNTNNISPAAPNRIKTITVEVGDNVRKGQTLVTLDKANIDQLQINIASIEREYKRAAELLEIGAGTQQAVDQLKDQLDGLKRQYANLSENTVLVSPINGVVTARNYDPGDMTGGQPVLTVGQITPSVKVIINVSESDLSKIQRGLPVEVSFDAYPGEAFSGAISRIYPTVDPNTRTFKSEILIDNPEGRIMPGMFARVNIELGTQHHIMVPDQAVVKQTGSGNKYIYVYKDGYVSYDKVELGQRLGDRYEILSGIEDGDSVVVIGQVRLADGVAVEVQQ